MVLSKLLSAVPESGDLGVEMHVILRMEPNAVQLKHSPNLMQIAMVVFDSGNSLAIATVPSMLQAFGKVGHAPLVMSSQGF
jgi:hypothetical protein